MGTRTVDMQDSGLNAKIDESGVLVEPKNRAQGFGVAMTLEEAISFAKMVLELEAMLSADEVGASE